MNKHILPLIIGIIALFGIFLVTKFSFSIYAFKELSCFFAGAFVLYILSRSFLDKSGFKISVLDIALAVSILFFLVNTNDFSFQNEFLFKTILSFAFYFIMRFLPQNSKLIKPIAYTLIFCFSVPAIIVIYQWIKDMIDRIYPPVDIPPENFATFSDYMIIGGLLSLCLYYLGNQNQETNTKRILYFNTVFFLPLIMVGQSVNQSVVYIAVIGIVIARCVFKEIFQKKYLFNYAIAFFFLSTLFFIPTVTNVIRKELRYIPISINAFRQNPITGTGFGTYNSTYNAAQSQYFYDKSNNVANIWGSLMSGKGVSSDDWTQYVNGKIPVDEYVIADKMKTPESDFIQILLETGLVGLVMFLIPVGIFIFSFYKLKDKQNNPVTIFALTIIGILLSTLVSFPFHETPLVLILAMMLGIVASNLELKTFVVPEKYGRIILGTFILLTVISCIGLFQIFSDKLEGQTAAAATKKGKFDENVYQTLYPKLKNNAEFLEDYGQALSTNKNYTQSINLLNEAMYYKLDAKILCLQAENYFQTQQLEKAKSCYQTATYIQLTDIFPRFEEMNFYLKIGNDSIANQKANFVYSMDINPKDEKAKIMKIRAQIIIDSLEKKQ